MSSCHRNWTRRPSDSAHQPELERVRAEHVVDALGRPALDVGADGDGHALGADPCARRVAGRAGGRLCRGFLGGLRRGRRLCRGSLVGSAVGDALVGDGAGAGSEVAVGVGDGWPIVDVASLQLLPAHGFLVGAAPAISAAPTAARPPPPRTTARMIALTFVRRRWRGGKNGGSGHGHFLTVRRSRPTPTPRLLRYRPPVSARFSPPERRHPLGVRRVGDEGSRLRRVG